MNELQNRIVRHLKGGARVFLCGNGGSAAIAQHVAAELMVKYRKVRRPLPAMALASDIALLTAHSNDFGYETVFARQLDAWMVAGDILIAMTTSGKSVNVLNAMAVSRGALVVVLRGETELETRHQNVYEEGFPGPTAEIQQGHLKWCHDLCEVIDEHFN